MSLRALSLASTLLVLAYGSVAVLWPEETLSPGHLLPGHADLSGDCLRCHRLFAGTPTEGCLDCHPLEKIDARAKAAGGAGTAAGALHTLFGDPECGGCHAEHAATLNRRPPVRFAHTALAASARDRCDGCHVAPADSLHASVDSRCGLCHRLDRWTPASFDHDSSATDRCRGCHAAPVDSLHASVDERCGQCHGTDRWKPADYDHDRYFRFDRAHPADCESCHPGGVLDRYTCYGCHEHSPQGMLREHAEEGIRDFEACVECHRSGDEHDIRRRGSGEHGDRGGAIAATAAATTTTTTRTMTTTKITTTTTDTE